MESAESLLLDLAVERHRPFRLDPHCHILPGIDDGSPDLETSLRMARRAAGFGVEVMVATPHACHPAVKVPINAEILRHRAGELNQALRHDKIPIQVLPGQEFLMDERLPQMFEAGELITWADQGRYVLIELGFHQLAPYALEILDYFRGRGLTPIIAHPERYNWWDSEPSVLGRLIERGCVFQLNVMSLNRLWGEEAYERGLYFMDHVPVWVAGTDSHSDHDRFWGLDQVRALLEARRNLVARRPAHLGAS